MSNTSNFEISSIFKNIVYQLDNTIDETLIEVVKFQLKVIPESHLHMLSCLLQKHLTTIKVIINNVDNPKLMTDHLEELQDSFNLLIEIDSIFKIEINKDINRLLFREEFNDTFHLIEHIKDSTAVILSLILSIIDNQQLLINRQ